MNAEFVNVLVALAYMAGGAVGIALLMWWALKRFGCPGEASPKIVAPKSKERYSRKAVGASIPPSRD